MARIFSHPLEMLDAVGETVGPSEWLTVTQERIDQFAQATDDHQWIHVDPERAARGPFGACIAHGYLTLSLVNRFLPDLIVVEGATMGVNYGCERLRFPNVVKAGQAIRGVGEITQAVRKGDAVHVVVKMNVEVEGEDRPACVVDTISRWYFRPQ